MSADDNRIERYLHGLPKVEPDAGLAAQVIESHLRRRRLRRGALAMAASVVLGAMGWQILRPLPEVPSVAIASPPNSAWVEIRALDRQLQAGYLADMSEAELSRLWQRRKQAVIRIDQQPAAHSELHL